MGRCRLLSAAALAALLFVACAAAPSHAGPVRDPAPSSAAPSPDEPSDEPSPDGPRPDGARSSATPGPGTPERAGALADGQAADPPGPLAPAQAADDVRRGAPGPAMPPLLLVLLSTLVALLLAAVPAVAYGRHEDAGPPADDGRWRRDWERLP